MSDDRRTVVGSCSVGGVYLGVPLGAGVTMGFVYVEPPPRRALRDDRSRTRTECSKKSRR